MTSSEVDCYGGSLLIAKYVGYFWGKYFLHAKVREVLTKQAINFRDQENQDALFGALHFSSVTPT